MRTLHFKTAILGILLLLAGGTALADGTETLGPPLGITIADGSGLVAGGTGLYLGQPDTIIVDVPGSVEQALLYWVGVNSTAAGDDSIMVNGTGYTGMKIGGFTFVNGPDTYISTYRADITAEVGSGLNFLDISGLSFDVASDGAGVLVIYDDGSVGDIGIRDGNDFAYILNAGPANLLTTVPQTFVFAPADSARTGKLTIMAADVEATRPNVVEVTVNGSVTEFFDLLDSSDGVDWDTDVVMVDVPAGATMLTVEAISDAHGTGGQPASLIWAVAALALEVPGQGDGCTPGYWKNHLRAWGPTGLEPGDDFDTTFGVDYYDPDITLRDALRAEDKKGMENNGGINKVARHGTAALLNALHPAVDYPASAADVIAAVQAGNVDQLVGFNELSEECPANAGGGGNTNRN